MEIRHFDLLPDKDWDVNLDAVNALADENTVAMVIINPGNPCGNVFTHQHLQKVAETAKKLGILVISDEVYDHLAFGKNPFVLMATFASITPVITLGSISKRWIVPGWRLGWLAVNDPYGILKEHRIIDCITAYLNITSDAPTFIQGAIPDILSKTKDDFFIKIVNMIKKGANICYEEIQDVPGLYCPSKPQGSMFVMIVQQGLMSQGDYDEASRKALSLFEYGQRVALEHGVILVDTKYEFGKGPDGSVLLIDEVFLFLSLSLSHT